MALVNARLRPRSRKRTAGPEAPPRQDRGAAIHARHPELGSPETPVSQLPEESRTLLMQELATAREESKAADNQDVVRALRQIVEQVPAA